MELFRGNVEGNLPSAYLIKQLYKYSFILFLFLIGARLILFQWSMLLIDIVSSIILWITVCTENKIFANLSLINATIGIIYNLIYAIQRISEISYLGIFSIILLFIMIIISLTAYALYFYASYYARKVFGWEFRNNINSQDNQDNQENPTDYRRLV